MIVGTYCEKNQCQGRGTNNMENYIGPYWSDGKWQESVEFGLQPALSGVDAASRLHDSAYAHYTDEAHRTAADEIYSATLKKLNEPLSNLADVPLYGNYIKNRAKEIGSDFVTGFKYFGLLGGLGSLVYNGVKNVVRSNDLIQNGDTYRKDVLAYYATDPIKPIVSEKTEKQKPIVSIPKTIAPLQTDTKEEMFKRKTKVQPVAVNVVPSSPARVPAHNQVAPAAQVLYRPLRAKKKKPITPGDLIKYLSYHPNEVEKVAAWLEKHPFV